ncbi:MAG TPA: TraR/DksA C4-type zinc finger protein [Candidatus Binatia bacterium]|nr:TraR/DksA C4-type zinc finger protein [Candidatus Binatia bacterium]
MDEPFLASIADQLQRERRRLIEQLRRNDASFEQITGTREAERDEHAQEERDTRVLENLDERQQRRVADIDAALARIEGGNFGRCQKCGGAITQQRLLSNPTATLCNDCSAREEQQPAEDSEGGATDSAASVTLPPDLELLDDDELAAHLTDIVRQDGQVDMDELQITAKNGLIILNGAVPSEAEHQILLNILTDVAGIQDLDDRLEIVRLAWERDDRFKDEAVQDVTPGTVPDQEPYAGTDDVVLSEEEGVTYEPPVNPPAPPYRKD